MLPALNYTPFGGPLAAAATDTQLTAAGLTDVTPNSYTIQNINPYANVLVPTANAGVSGLMFDGRASSKLLNSSINLSFLAGNSTVYVIIRAQAATTYNNSYIVAWNSTGITVSAVGNTGTFTQIGSTISFSWVQGGTYNLQIAATGTSPTTLTLTVPRVSLTPYTFTDSTAGLQATGYMGIVFYGADGATQVDNIYTQQIFGTTSVTNNAANITTTAAAIGGTAPYVYKLYVSETSTPDVAVPATPSGTLIYTSAATSGTATYTYTPPDSNPQYFRWVATDSSGTPIVTHSNQLVGLIEPTLYIACFGDSITAGANASTNQDPVTLLPAAINNLIQPRNITALKLGVSGTATPDWVPGSTTGIVSLATQMASAAASAGATNPLIVQIMLGGNDGNSSRRTTQAQYAANMQAIIAYIKAYANINLLAIIVHDTLYIMPGSFGLYDETTDALIQSYRSVNAGLADNSKVFLGDTQGYQIFSINPQYYSDIGVHPNNAGYAVLANLWAKAYLQVLSAFGPMLTTGTSYPDSVPISNLATGTAYVSIPWIIPASGIPGATGAAQAGNATYKVPVIGTAAVPLCNVMDGLVATGKAQII